MFASEALGLSKHASKTLEEKNILREALIPHPFFSDIIEALRFDRKFGEIEEGTVVAKTINGVRIVRGFPKIRRALTLYPSIRKHFEREVAVEEKMNGYNIRIAKLGKNLYALTRRGYICPYTTEKVRKKGEMADFFKDFPNHALCCEAVGEESPFVPKKIYGIKELDFFVFDIRELETNNPLRVDEKIRLCEEYSIEHVPFLGTYESRNAHEIVKDLIHRLGKSGREGVVMKDPEMKIEPLKYTTSETNAGDLSYAFRFFNDYGKDFMFSRIIREGFQSFEFAENQEEFRERCLRLGMAILKPMIESIKDVSNGEWVSEKIKLRFDDIEVLELFLKHLRKMGVDFRVRNIVKSEKGAVLHFERVMRSTTDKIRTHLEGQPW